MFLSPCFPRADAISSSVANVNPLLLITRLGSFEFLMWIGSAFHHMKGFYFQYVLCLPLAVHLDKQVSIPCFLNSFQTSPCRDYLRKGENLARKTSS